MCDNNWFTWFQAKFLINVTYRNRLHPCIIFYFSVPYELFVFDSFDATASDIQIVLSGLLSCPVHAADVICEISYRLSNPSNSVSLKNISRRPSPHYLYISFSISMSFGSPHHRMPAPCRGIQVSTRFYATQ